MKADASLVPPIRQTASIFKQPVTVHKNINDNKSKTDLKPSSTDKPRQVFWEKRLEGLRACASDGEEFTAVDLGKCKILKSRQFYVIGDIVLTSLFIKRNFGESLSGKKLEEIKVL